MNNREYSAGEDASAPGVCLLVTDHRGGVAPAAGRRRSAGVKRAVMTVRLNVDGVSRDISPLTEPRY